MFIDIHAHAYRKPVELPLPFLVKFSTAEEVLKRYDEMGIAMGCLLPIVNPEIYMPQANEDILDMAEQYPDRFIPFCNIDPRALTNSADAPLDYLFRYYKDKGCKGLGEVMLNVPVMHPMVQNLFKHAEAVGLPVTFDGSDQVGGDFGLYDDPGLPQLEHTLQKFPNLFILGHGPIFWSEIAKLETPGERGFVFRHTGDQVGLMPNTKIVDEGVVPKLFRRYPNLLGDLSDFTCCNAFARDADYGSKFMTEFQDRLFYGTDILTYDTPLPLMDLMKTWLAEGRISQEVFDKISHKNAIKFLDLKI